jgi:hypothetical protein
VDQFCMSVWIWFSIVTKKCSLDTVECLDKNIWYFRDWLCLHFQFFLYQWPSVYKMWYKMTLHNSKCLLGFFWLDGNGRWQTQSQLLRFTAMEFFALTELCVSSYRRMTWARAMGSQGADSSRMTRSPPARSQRCYLAVSVDTKWIYFCRHFH